MSAKLLDGVNFSVTPYKGYENEALGVFNRTRGANRTREHFDWRYLGEKYNNSSSLVFWVHLQDGSRVGMAGLVPRPYWVDGDLTTIWVLGDISLDASLRGQGIGNGLFRFMNSYMEKSLFQGGFVIPNEQAKKSLLAAGWSRPKAFVWYLSIVNPVSRIFPRLSTERPGKLMNTLYQRVMSYRLSRHVDAGLKLVETNDFDGSFDSLWQDFSKNGVIIRHRGSRSLQWRFGDHPCIRYRILKLIDDKLVGYIVYELQSEGVCRVVDLLCVEDSYLRPMMALFLERIYAQENVNSVRIKLSENHVWERPLKEVGFMKRLEGDVFQVYDQSAAKVLNAHRWLVSVADKDA